MSGVLGESRRGCGRLLTIRMIAIAIAVPLVCVCIVIPLWMVGRMEMNIWWLIVPAVLFLLVLIGGGIGALVLVIFRRTQGLNQAVFPLGLHGDNYQLFYRQYHGGYKGREASIYFYRGPTIEIDILTSLNTRMGISREEASTLMLADLIDEEPIPIRDPQLNDLFVFALDKGWGQQLLTSPHVPSLLRQLIHTDDAFPSHQILLMPGLLRLRLFGSRNLLDLNFDTSSEQLGAWLEALVALVDIAESLPAPHFTNTESSAERAARSLRESNPNYTLLFTLGMVLVMALCSILIGVAAFWWALAQ